MGLLSKSAADHYLKAMAFVAALSCACVLFGAIPWVSVPTLGQALWASGFAQSYANAGGFTFHATDFGLPTPAPIAFGLSATFVQGLLIRLFGIDAIDAYTLTVVIYLAVALYGAKAMARLLGAPYFLALVIALLWISLPIVCGHTGYSMLALGFALLPLYLRIATWLFVSENHVRSAMAAILYIIVCTFALFMDGYTFMMFFAASAALLAIELTGRASRKRAFVFALPSMAVGFFLAKLAYTSFIHGNDYTPSPMDFFRGWGVDVTMLLTPTLGVHWLWDVIGLASPRNSRIFWGDDSVWVTTFLMPLIVSGVAGYALARDRKRATALLVISLIGIYLSLGPSLKFASTKQRVDVTQEDRGLQLMRETYAIAPTGSEWLSSEVPGFREMRASYRWAALGALGLWALTALLLVRIHERRPALAYAIPFLLVGLFLPHVQKILKIAIENRVNAHSITAALAKDLHDVAGAQGILFFAPFGNDMIVNYLSATTPFSTYNIGGNKNAELAQISWTAAMRELSPDNLSSPQFQSNMRLILLSGDASAVVMPYFDTLTAALFWPPDGNALSVQRTQRLPIAHAAAATPCFRVDEFQMFAAVSLSEVGRQVRQKLIAEGMNTENYAKIVDVCALSR